MQYLLQLNGHEENGGSSLVMHNERLADPLNEHARLVAEIAKKKNKTEADHIELGRREFTGSMYVNGNGPCIPAFNILRCLQEGGQRRRRGKDVLRGVYPATEHADLIYEGPRDVQQLWKSEDPIFWLRKTVGVGGRRPVRTRPIFSEWEAELAIEVDPIIFDIDTLESIWTDSGKYIGLGEMRPIYGRFLGTIVPL